MIDPTLTVAVLCALQLLVFGALGWRALKTTERLTSELASVKSPEATVARGQVEAMLNATRQSQDLPADHPAMDPFSGLE